MPRRHVHFAEELEIGPADPASSQLQQEFRAAVSAPARPLAPKQLHDAAGPRGREEKHALQTLWACLSAVLQGILSILQGILFVMGSLFDRITPRDPPTASSTPYTSSIFANAPAPAQQPSTGLFSHLGSTSTSQPAESSLFGATTSAPLFRNNPVTSNPSYPSLDASTTGSGLFGASTASSKPANSGSSLFGGTNQQYFQPATGTSGNASLFGNNILPSTRTDQSIIDRAYDPNAAPANPAYFHALLERGKKRHADENNTAFGALPQLQLGLQDISRKVRNIGQGGPSAGLARGENSLAASGINANQALRDIDDLESSTATARPPPTERFDYETPAEMKEALGYMHTNQFGSKVDDAYRRAQIDFNKMIQAQLHDMDWTHNRQRIYEHFGLRKPKLGSADNESTTMRESGGFGRLSRHSKLGGASFGQSFGLPGATRSVIGSTNERSGRISTFGDVADKLTGDGLRPAPEDRVQRIKQAKYADKVKELNVARMQENAYPLLHKFNDIEAEPSHEDTSMLINAYNALIEITGEDASKENMGDPGAVKERQYVRDYLEDNHNAPGHVAIRKRIVTGSRRFLEKLFLRQAEATVARNPREANIGGVPTSVAMIKGYVRVRAARKELGPDVEDMQEINGDYCWPVLFYLLRAGLYQEALEYVEENANAFRQIDRSFVRYLRAYVTSDEHRLPSDMQNSINNEYSQRQRLAPEDSIDPYRMVCYKVIGRCDLNRRSLDNITNDMLDWTWLQFSLAREYNRVDEFAHEAFGLDELRQSIKEIGERYFGAGSEIANAPTTLFFMQILAGMFEKAVADLYPFNYVTATHFAIALSYYGLLRASDIANSEDLLTHTTRQEAQIAFGSMLGLYTRDFRTADATAAVDYLTLICLNQDLTGALGKAQRELCHQALTEVVLETREFAQLLGDIRSDGVRIKGAVQQRLQLIGLENEQEFLKYITLVAARTAEQQSRATDAVLLFHLAEDYDKVLQVLNAAVSESLTTELGEQRKPITPLKPRNVNQQDGQQAIEQPQGSLSLTAVDDPIELANNMTNLYASDAMYYSKIKSENVDCCRILLKLSDARRALEKGRWPLAIDVSTNITHINTNTTH